MPLFNITPASLVSDALTVIDLLNLGGSQDTVAFFDQSNPGNQIFSNARPLKATIKETIKTMQHPVETGQVVADYKIINPREIDVSLLITSEYYLETYNEIKQYFNTSNLIGFSMRVGYITNLIVSDMPHDETPDIFDAITMNLHLKEVLFVPTPAPYDPAGPGGGGIAGVTDPITDNEGNNIQSVTSVGQVTGQTLSLNPPANTVNGFQVGVL